MRLIDADAFRKDYGFGTDCNDCKQNVRNCGNEQLYTRMDICGFLDDAPTIERPKGKWVTGLKPFRDAICCSNCGEYDDTNFGFQMFDFCPYCGADMRE